MHMVVGAVPSPHPLVIRFFLCILVQQGVAYFTITFFIVPSLMGAMQMYFQTIKILTILPRRCRVSYIQMFYPISCIYIYS